MANKTLFKSLVGKFIRPADTRNEAGGLAYSRSPKEALAQFAATGCLNSTFYVDAEDQLAQILTLAGLPVNGEASAASVGNAVEPEFIAKTALYARRQAHMKDVPALLLAVLAVRSPGLFAEVFDRVADNGRMLRNFVQIVRSGVTGRKSLGTLPKRMVRQWLEQRDDDQIFFASVGNDPSLADVVKMVHPKPATDSRRALYGYLVGKEHDASKLPELVRAYEAFKRGDSPDMPDVPHELLTALPLSRADWKLIAYRASWQATRMNLNTFARHGVFEDHAMAESVAAKLRDPERIARARVFPYQLMVAHASASKDVPSVVKNALQDALELALANVPPFMVEGRPGKVWVFPDVSGSMNAPATGYRKGATSVVTCLEVAGLIAAAVLRKNPNAGVIPFHDEALEVDLNPRDSVVTTAKRLASLPPGGTSCSAPLALLNKRRETGDLVVYVSDNQSWVDLATARGTTETMRQWAAFKQRNPRARLVAIDLQPSVTTQVTESADILNVGGFSDRVFDVIAKFVDGSLTPDHWVGVIEQERL